MEKKTLGNFIAVLRKAKGLTQQELADKLCVSNKAVSKWECNETCPDISLIPIIAEILEVSCDELLRGERIFTSDKNEKAEIKSEKQLKFLVNKSVYTFKNISLISFILLFLGVIAMFTISYAAYRPDIGFGISMSMFLVAVITEIFALNWINNKTDNNEILEGNAENNTHLKTVYNVKFNYSFWVFYLSLTFIFLFLPLVSIRHSNIIQSVLSFEYFLSFIPFFTVMPFSLFFPLKMIYKGIIFKNIKAKNLINFDLIQNAFLLLGFIIFFYNFFNGSYFNDSGVIFYITLLLLLSLAVSIILTRKKATSLKMVIITLKTLLYLFAFYLFCNNLFVSYIPSSIYFYSSIKIWLNLLLVLVTTFGYSFFAKKKNLL